MNDPKVMERTLESGANMSANATAGVATPAESKSTAPVDREAIVALAMKHAATKKGGMSFKTGVLKDKVRAEVRSRLGLDRGALVPADVNDVICDVCDAVVNEFNAMLARQGFTAERSSGERRRVKGGEGEESLDLVRTVTHAKPLTLAEQRQHAKLELAGLADKLDKWERGQLPNGNPDNRDAELRTKALNGMLARKARLEAVVSNAKRELSRIETLAKANGLA